MVSDEIFDTAKQVGLTITDDSINLEIKHKIRFSDKSMFGILIFILGGILFIAIPFIKTIDTTSKILSFLIGLSFFVFGVLTFIRQFSDSLKITAKKMTFRYNLKSTSIPLDKSLIVKMKTEIMKVSRVATVGTDIIIITHYLKTIDKEIPIFRFQLENKYSDKAIRLGNTITTIFNNRLLNA